MFLQAGEEMVKAVGELICGPKSMSHGSKTAYGPVMGHNKDKAGREAKKPKQDKKAKPAAPAPVIPVSTHAHDAPHK